MEVRTLVRLFLPLLWLIPATEAAAAENPEGGVRSANFIIFAEDPEHAEEISRAAERHRKDLAKAWLGKELPAWADPIPVTVREGLMGAGGNTSFSFQYHRKTQRYEVVGWTMRLQGPLDLILSSVLPHEITHTILAGHFRCPIPRWADEGAAILGECEAERSRQIPLVQEALNNGTQFSLPKLMSIMEYPQDAQAVLILHAQGYSLTDLLVQIGGGGIQGRRSFVKFLEHALQHQRDGHHDWNAALRSQYQNLTLKDLESRWKARVFASRPSVPIGASTGRKLTAIEIGLREAFQATGPRVKWEPAGKCPTLADRLTSTASPATRRLSKVDHKSTNNDAVGLCGHCLFAMSLEVQCGAGNVFKFLCRF